MSENAPQVAEDQAAQTPAARPAQAQLRVDDSNILALYANFCRVTGTPEELIIDFGLNPQPVGIPTEPIKVGQRIIVNFFTAKRLLGALSMSVQRHEAVFGVLETDINKRLRMPQATAWLASVVRGSIQDAPQSVIPGKPKKRLRSPRPSRETQPLRALPDHS